MRSHKGTITAVLTGMWFPHCRENFSELFNNDREELDEAVSFLNLQGTVGTVHSLYFAELRTHM